MYDPEHNACAIEFDKDDCISTSVENGKLFMQSFNGGKPKFVKEQLLFELEVKDENKR